MPGNDRLQRLSPLLLEPEQSHLAGTVVAKAHRLACLAIGSRSSKCRVIGLLAGHGEVRQVSRVMRWSWLSVPTSSQT